MKSIPVSNYGKKKQEMLCSYFNNVLMDFDSLFEIKKIKEFIKKEEKKTRNK